MPDQLTPEDVVRRICTNIERCDKAMGGELLKQLPEVPFRLRRRLMDAVNNFRDKLIHNGQG